MPDFLFILASNLPMKEIFPIIDPFDKLLEKQPYSQDAWEQYRPLTYCVTEHIPEGMLLFNNLTKSMVLLSDAEMKSVRSGGASLPELVEKWFYVPEDHDDKTLCQQVRNVASMLRPTTKGFNSYTIFTTTDCNARCFYCFEKSARRIPMSPAVAEKTAGFIAEHCGGKDVSLSWFGGEPLYNMEAIDIICRRLEENGIAFHSKMTSNGYLFDKEIVRKAKEDWKLKNVQITLDGTEEIYNKAKAFIYKGVNAFRRVIGNIHLLLDAGIGVDIRLNIDTYNSDDLMKLSGLIIEEFSGKPGLYVYVHPLFGDNMHYAVDNPAKRKDIFEKMEKLQDTFDGAGMGRISLFKRYIKTNCCMSDSATSLAVFPSGQFGKCEHYTDEYFVGHLDKGEVLDQEEVTAFSQIHPDIEECDNCPIYPDCIRLVRCASFYNCYLESRNYWLRQIRAEMRAVYYAKKKNADLDESEIESMPC